MSIFFFSSVLDYAFFREHFILISCKALYKQGKRNCVNNKVKVIKNVFLRSNQIVLNKTNSLVNLVVYMPQVVRTDLVFFTFLLLTDQKKKKLCSFCSFSPLTPQLPELTPRTTNGECFVSAGKWLLSNQFCAQWILCRHFHLLCGYSFFKVTDTITSFLNILI